MRQQKLSSSSLSAASPDTAPPPTDDVGVVTDLSAMEFKVGKVMSVERHPEASGLYVEKIDIGNCVSHPDFRFWLNYSAPLTNTGEPTGPRTIVSGLAQYLTEEQLLNRMVIVLCNLKPRAFKGVMSHGMIMCTSNESHTKVDPIIPPASSAIGELIRFPGHLPAPVEAGNKATKVFTKIAEYFHASDDGVARFKDSPFMTSSGPVTASFKGKIS